jgi:citrate synthase
VTPQTIRWIPSTHTFSSMLTISCDHLQKAQAITLLVVAITGEETITWVVAAITCYAV